MTTAATSLLGLALPVTGELSGTWGDTVNNSITSLLDSAVAGTTTLSTDADVTLTTTTLAANQAREAILLFSGARTALRTVTAPAQSKIYTVINATTGGFAVKLVGVGPTTGLSIPAGASAVVAWNGSDFVEIGATTLNSLTVSGNLTVAGTTTLSSGAANGVAYLNGSKVLTTGSALTFDGTVLTNTQSSAASGVIANLANSTTGALLQLSSVGVANVRLGSPNADAIAFYTFGAGSYPEQMRLTSTGLGIGTSSPAYKLDALGAAVGSNTIQAIAQLRSASDALNNGVELLFTPIISGQTRTAIGGVREGSTVNAALYFATNNIERMRLDASGNLLTGTTAVGSVSGNCVNLVPTSAGGYIAVGHNTGTSSGNYYSAFYYAGTAIGSITQAGTTGVLYNVTSDQRLKENIADAPEFGSVIDSLQVRSYDWKTNQTHQRAGFIAQELVTVAPEAVHQPENPEEMMAVDYSKLVPMLVKEIQSLRKRLTALETK